MADSPPMPPEDDGRELVERSLCVSEKSRGIEQEFFKIFEDGGHGPRRRRAAPWRRASA